MTTHSSILAWRIPIDRGAWWATVHGVPKSRTGRTHLISPRRLLGGEQVEGLRLSGDQEGVGRESR